jgi:hypothetical protein
MRVVQSHDASDTYTGFISHDVIPIADRALHDTETEHGCERHPLAEGNLNFGEVLRGPEKDDEITQCVLGRVKVVDCFDVETLCCEEVLEDVPVRACRSVEIGQHVRLQQPQ